MEAQHTKTFKIQENQFKEENKFFKEIVKTKEKLQLKNLSLFNKEKKRTKHVLDEEN